MFQGVNNINDIELNLMQKLATAVKLYMTRKSVKKLSVANDK